MTVWTFIRIERLCARFLVAKPNMVAVLALAILAILGTGLDRLEIKTGYRDLFHADDPLLLAIDAMNDRYGSGDGLILMISARDGDVLDQSGLRAISALTRSLDALPQTRRVTSLSTQRRVTRTAIGTMLVDLIPEQPPRRAGGLKRLRKNILTTSGVAETLVTRGGDATLIRVEVSLRDGDHTALVDFTRKVRALIDDVKATDPDLSVALGGLVTLNDALVQATHADMRVLFPAMGVLLCLGLLVFTRSLRGVAGPLIVVGAAVVAAIGAAGWLGVPVTPILSITPTIVLGIGIADSLHILVSTDRAGLAGAAARPALYKALRRNFGPISLTTLTTGVGFLCLMFSESPPFRDLGLISAIGVLAALFFTLTLLPAISVIAPGKIRSGYNRMGQWIGKILDVVTRRRRVALVVIGVLVAIAGAGLSQTRSDDQLTQWFDESLAFKQDLNTIRDTFGPTERASWVIPLPRGRDTLDARFLGSLDTFSTWLEDQPEVADTITLSSILEPLSAKETLAAEIATLDRLHRSEQGRDRLSALLSRDMDETRVIVILENGSTLALQALAARAEAWTGKQPGPISEARPSGPVWSLAKLVSSSTQTMLIGTTVAFLVIAACLGLLLRSWRLGVVGLTAMVVPPALVYGIWSWTGRPIGLAESVVAATSLGLLVDISIHILTRYRAGALVGLDPRVRIRRAFEAAGPALLTGFLILIAGFAVLTLSPFRGNMHFGLLTAATLAVGLPVAVLVLPFGLKQDPGASGGDGDQSTTITPGSRSSSV
ncbi:MAG: MMPL family transporter [Alphaproteobacteria bacterium]|nr:MMPL family transporter [Alphaproteobacteria bacterium]